MQDFMLQVESFREQVKAAEDSDNYRLAMIAGRLENDIKHALHSGYLTLYELRHDLKERDS